MTNQDALPAVCDSCGDPTATPPDCEDCRAEQIDQMTAVLADGWQLSTGQGRWLLAEVGRLRDTLARRGEEYDAVRHARADAEERARYHQNKRSQEAREIAAVTHQRDDAWAELVDLRATHARIVEHRAEAIDALTAERDRLAAQVRRVSLVHCWTNEDGKRFLFADDVLAALKPEVAR